jgi:hypothetical protein
LADIYRTEVPGGILYTPIEVSASGTLVVGVAGRKIVVLSFYFVCSSAVNVKFQTSTGSIDISGPAYCIANGGVVNAFNAGGWFQTLVGDSLLINLSSGVAIGGSLSYILV